MPADPTALTTFAFEKSIRFDPLNPERWRVVSTPMHGHPLTTT